MSQFLWGLSHAKKSEAWLAYRDRPVARPIAIDDYLSRGVKRGELFKIDLQLIQDNQKRHNGELFKIKFAVV
ncbi:hypothetical protein NKC03_001346 [Salmonella enterica]|nr:hypothetical protein [Salmonella enterica]